jgi:hypothetical protein
MYSQKIDNFVTWRSVIFYTDLVQKPFIGVFSDAYPGPRYGYNFVSPDAGLQKRAIFFTLSIGPAKNRTCAA